MSLQVKLEVGEVYKVNSFIESFVANTSNIGGDEYAQLLDLQEPFEAQIEKSKKVEEKLKAQYPFKWASEIEGYYETKDTNERMFTGERKQDSGGDDEVKKQARAKADRKAFEDEWTNKYWKKEVTLDLAVSTIPKAQTIIKGSSAPGQAFYFLKNALSIIREASFEKKEKPKENV